MGDVLDDSILNDIVPEDVGQLNEAQIAELLDGNLEEAEDVAAPEDAPADAPEAEDDSGDVVTLDDGSEGVAAPEDDPEVLDDEIQEVVVAAEGNAAPEGDNEIQEIQEVAAEEQEIQEVRNPSPPRSHDDEGFEDNEVDMEDVEREEENPGERGVLEAEPKPERRGDPEVGQAALNQFLEGFGIAAGDVEGEIVEEEIVEEEIVEEEEEVLVIPKVQEEVIICDDDDDDDIQIYEDYHGEGTSTSNHRKRVANGHHQAPYNKRARRPQATSGAYLEARNAAIDKITQILGSWDAQLTVPNLRLLKEMNMSKLKDIEEEYEKMIDDLVEENNKLKEENLMLKRGEGAALKVIKSLRAETEELRTRVEDFSQMVVQPRCITICDDVPPTAEQVEEGKRLNVEIEKNEVMTRTSMMSTAPPVRRPSNNGHNGQYHQQQQHYHSPAHQMHMQHQHQQLQQHLNGHQRAMMNHPSSSNMGIRSQNGRLMRPPQQFQGAPIVLPDGTLPAVRGRTAKQAAELLARHGMPLAPPQPPRQPQFQDAIAGGPRWVPLTSPAGMGHTQGTLEPQVAQKLIDDSNENFIKLLIPFVPAPAIISTGDASRLPKVPACYEQLQKCPDLTVTITSSQRDFRDNWQIGGRINYEYLGMLEDTKIQVYIQVGSLKFHGMNGCTQPGTFPIDWGISESHQCKAKSHKFRVLFHQRQLIPINDRITIMAVAKNESTGSVQISQPVFMTFQ